MGKCIGSQCRNATTPKSTCGCDCTGKEHGEGHNEAIGQTPMSVPGETSTTHTLGITPFRGTPGTTAGTTDSYYNSSRAKHFEQVLQLQADADGVTLGRLQRCPGMWEGTFEPSYALEVTGTPTQVQSFSAKMCRRYNQKAVMVFQPDPTGVARTYTIDCPDPDLAMSLLQENGLDGGRWVNGRLEIADGDGTQFDNARAIGRQLDTPVYQESGHLSFVGQTDIPPQEPRQ